MEIDICSLADEIINGRMLQRGENFDFFLTCDLEELCRGADKIRKHFVGDRIDLCTIINGRSGRCSENCKFCAQSSFHKTECDVYDFISTDKIVERAKADAEEGVDRFSIVTAGKKLSGEEFEKALAAYKILHNQVDIDLCASMGFLDFDQLKKLKEVGVTSYHHNIETSKRNFPNICSTHTYEMKIQTLKMVKECGLSVCSGGIIGMGETFEDRIDMALSLSEVGVDSIPINVLTPVKGTPLENMPTVSEDDILRTVAIFRYFNPKSTIRLAAGRRLMTNAGEKVFQSGANATITGNMLTTSGTTIKGDKELILKLGRTKK